MKRAVGACLLAMEPLTADVGVFAAVLGLAAGLLSTSAGFGGGLVLTAGLGLVLGPTVGLTVAAPALLIGHLHRAHALRTSVDWPVALRFSLGALPGAVLGGIALVALPPQAVWWIIGAAAVFALVEGLGWISPKFGRNAVAPGGAAVGFLASSGGGGGVLLPPTLLGAGLRGASFVATAAVGAVAVHIGRIGAYAGADMFTTSTLSLSLAVGLGTLAGNALGRPLLRMMTPERQRRVAQVILLITLCAAIYGAL